MKYDWVKRLNTNCSLVYSRQNVLFINIYIYIIYITCVDACRRGRGKTSCCIICRFRIIVYTHSMLYFSNKIH